MNGGNNCQSITNESNGWVNGGWVRILHLVFISELVSNSLCWMEVFSEPADLIGYFVFLSADEKQRQLSEEDGAVEMTAARVDQDVVSPRSQDSQTDCPVFH